MYGPSIDLKLAVLVLLSDWLLKILAPFGFESSCQLGRTIDLAGIGHALHQRSAVAPARVGLRCCGPRCRRQVRRKDLLWLAEPALSADGGAALLDGDKATVSTAAVAVDSAPFIGISRARTGREQHHRGSYHNHHQYADTAHPVRLPRPLNERPGGRCAAKTGDKLASSHCPHRSSKQGIVAVQLSH